MPCSLWLDETTWQPVKMELDLTGMVESILRQLAEDPSYPSELVKGISVTGVHSTMTFTSYDGIDEIEIPQEVLEARSF